MPVSSKPEYYRLARLMCMYVFPRHFLIVKVRRSCCNAVNVPILYLLMWGKAKRCVKSYDILGDDAIRISGKKYGNDASDKNTVESAGAAD